MEIKQAFINMCKECHPDVNNSPEATEQFRNVREAYRVLSNANSKISYDFEIGNVKNDSYDSDEFQNRSVKRTSYKQPGDSVAERAAKQRWVVELYNLPGRKQTGSSLDGGGGHLGKIPH